MTLLVEMAIISFIDLLTSGDLDFNRKVTKFFLCTPWYTIYHRCDFEVIPSIGLGGVPSETDRQIHTYTDAFGVLVR